MKKKLLFLSLVCMSLFWLGSEVFGGDDLILEKMRFGREKRSYWVYLPEGYDGEEALPMVFAFHGYTAYAEGMVDYVDFRRAADAHGVIMVFPQGSLLDNLTHWNVGGWTNHSKKDDVGFVNAIIDAMEKKYSIDPNRVYATGHSNGGYMSIKLACELGDRIAAVASVSGSMTPEMFADCAPSRPMPIMEIHSYNDPVVLYDGTEWSLPVEEMIDFWREADGCVGKGTMEVLPKSEKTTYESSVEHYSYATDDGVVMVELYKVNGGGHEWLNAMNDDGKMNWDIDSVETIFAFFDRFDLNGVRE